MELVNVINQRLSVSLPATLTYSHPSITAIATHLASLQPAAASPVSPLQPMLQSPRTAAFTHQGALLNEGPDLALETISRMLATSMASTSRLQGAAIVSSSTIPLMGNKPGLDCLGQVPLQRWDINGEVKQPMGQAVRFGAFMEGVDLFDNSLFGCAWHVRGI